ncbi:MAG: carbohydrate-binding domain-containing protein [Anaerolineae bacterium]
MRRIIAVALALTLALTACADATVDLPKTSGVPDTSGVPERSGVPETPSVAQPPARTEEADAVVSAAEPTSEDLEPATTLTPVTVEYDADDLNTEDDAAASTMIELSGEAITVEGDGVTVDGTRATITAAGIYNVSGVLDDGQIIVDTGDDDKVVLVLDGVDINCATGAPIYVVNADKTVITLVEGTENTVTDGESYVLEEGTDEPNAAIFSHDDLTINGDGALIVNANYNHGIAGKDDLKVTGGTITVNAVNDGLKGRDSLAIKAGILTVNAGGDGLQSNNDEEAEQGYILIEHGTLNITAALDGIQAESRLSVTGGTINIVSGGGSANSSTQAGWGDWRQGGNAGGTDTGDSAKGLKAGEDVTITDGILTIDASDDAIHSNGSMTIGGGELLLASGDDGMHADTTLTIEGGSLSITQSYEGIESALITINDGTIRVLAGDDGINVSGGSDGSAMGGRPGQNTFATSGTDHLYLNGGYIYIYADGDGIDANSPIDMTGGSVIINGPTVQMNGPLDYMGEFKVTGGFMVAAGSAGMAQAPSASSTQNSVLVVFNATLPAGTVVRIESDDGEDVLTFVPTKAYQSLVLSSPNLSQGATYTVYTGGSTTGTAVDGSYNGGNYEAGEQVTDFTVSTTVTGAGSYEGGFRGRPGGGPPGRPGGQRP